MDLSSEIKRHIMMNKILWIDDDINSVALRGFVDEFSDDGIEIEKVNNPDAFEMALEQTSFDCLIMDMMMPTGSNLSLQETRGGLHTGLRLLESYLKKGNTKPIVIFTVLNDEIIRKWSNTNNVPYKLKQHEEPETFSSYIKSIIGQSRS